MKRAAVAWLGFTCLAVGFFHEAMKLPFGRVNAPGAGFFPTVLGVLLGLMSVAGFFAEFRGGTEQKAEDGRLVWNKIIITIAALLAFAVIFEYAGYLITTFLFIAFSLRVVEGRSWWQTGTVAFAAALVSYIIFHLLLGAPLPAGIFGA